MFWLLQLTLIPRGKDREGVSYVIYLTAEELSDSEKAQRLRNLHEVAPEGHVVLVFTDVESSTKSASFLVLFGGSRLRADCGKAPRVRTCWRRWSRSIAELLLCSHTLF